MPYLQFAGCLVFRPHLSMMHTQSRDCLGPKPNYPGVAKPMIHSLTSKGHEYMYD